MTTIAKAVALAWVAAVAAPAGATAPSAAPQTPCTEQQGTCRAALSAAHLFVLADRYAQAGRLDETERLLEALTEERDREIRTEAFFRLGNVRANRGKLDGAAQAYRSALEQDPNAARVRLELARVLTAAGDEEAARRQLMRAEATGLPENVARVVDRFARALRSKRPYGASFEFGFAPDTNINRASASETVEIGPLPLELDKDARAQSGLGVIVGGQGYWRAPLGQSTNLLARSSAQGNLYRRRKFNDLAASLIVGPELLMGRSRLRPAVVGTRRWFGGAVYSDSVGATVNLLHPLDPRTQLDVDASVQFANYRRNEGLDGWQFSLAPRAERAFTPGLYGRVGLRVDRSEARDAAYRTWTFGGEALLSQDLGRETVFARGGLYRTLGDGPFAIAPARKDMLLEAQAGFLSRRFRIGDLLPGARLNYTKNASPVFFYDFSRLRLELFLSKEF
jgi:hypothetical protein